MKALQFEKPEAFRIVDLPDAPPPGPGEVLVRVHRVGICGTDYSGYLGKMPFFSYPRIPGHELGVEAVAVGEGVENVKPGDRASVEPYLSCYRCHACLRGHTNCCENNRTLGVHCDGGLRPYFAVPAKKLHPSARLTFDQLALVETLAIGCHAVNRGAPRPTEHVLVVGAGPIGLSAVEFSRLSGARTIVMDTNADRLAFVRERLGVPDTILSRGDGEEVSALRERTGGTMADVVIDATGSHRSMSGSLEYCAFAGRWVYVGITQENVSFAHAPVFHRRELTLLASRNALPAEFARIVAAIENGELNTDPWITHRTTLEELPKVFPEYLRPETRVIKAMVEIPDASSGS